MGTEPFDIEGLIAALAAPGVLPGSGDGLTQVVQTHISVVFLTREHAFKLKKPVDFGFLDFSTADRRAHFCREELRLNRRLAPEIYLGLSPVWFRPKGRVEVGSPVDSPPKCDELLVVMNRLPAERMMDRMLAEGTVEPVHVERLARLLVGFHERAEHGTPIDRYGTRDAAGRLALENFDQTERFCLGDDPLFDAGVHKLVRARTAAFLETRERLFMERVRSARVRDCHGDLHSPNICIMPDGRPVVYDCIEFSPAYRCGDVASEVAFMAMDLDFRGRHDLASVFVEAYCTLSGDPTAGAMLPFYETYRAMVRAKIAALTASAPEVSPALRDAQAAAARQLFGLAEEYSRGLVPPVVIVLAGLTGVGKTAVATALHERAGLPPLETDRIRKGLAGLDPQKPAAAPPGEGIYTQAMTHATYRALSREAATRIERGEGALVVGTFVSKGQRDEIRDTAKDARAPLLFVHLVAPEAVVVERLENRPPGVSDGDVAVYRSMLEKQDLPDEIAATDKLEIDTSTMTPDEAAETILARLRKPFEP